LFGVNPLK